MGYDLVVSLLDFNLYTNFISFWCVSFLEIKENFSHAWFLKNTRCFYIEYFKNKKTQDHIRRKKIHSITKFIVSYLYKKYKLLRKKKKLKNQKSQMHEIKS